MPSPLLSSLTSRMTRKRRKKVMEMRALSSVFCRELSMAESVEMVSHEQSCRHRAPPGCASQDDEGLVLDPEARYIWAERQTMPVQTLP